MFCSSSGSHKKNWNRTRWFYSEQVLLDIYQTHCLLIEVTSVGGRCVVTNGGEHLFNCWQAEDWFTRRRIHHSLRDPCACVCVRGSWDLIRFVATKKVTYLKSLVMVSGLLLRTFEHTQNRCSVCFIFRNIMVGFCLHSNSGWFLFRVIFKLAHTV